jgi:CTD small phosphatase-like protein 2
MEHDENFYDALKFIKTIPKIDLFERPRITIPNKDVKSENGFKYCLVLDLDETLVHSSIEPQSNPDDVFLIEMNENRYTIYVK